MIFIRARKIAAIAGVILCSGACATMPSDAFPDPGHVLATVTDQNNAPVPGANVQLFFQLNYPQDGTMWRSAVTDGSGKAAPGETDGGVLPGDYYVKVVPPTGYTVPSTQTNPIAISLQSNKTISLSYKLTKTP